MTDDVLARIDDLFARRIDDRTAPSAVWGVFDRDGLVGSGGHGDRGDGARPDEHTVYRIASCTKSFTAASILLLEAAGSVDLDAPITRWVPAFADVRLPTGDSPVPTPRMLLTMSGGFPTDDPWADRQESISDADLDAVLRGGLLFDSVPGTRFAYSNLGYALLGRVVAQASGSPYAAFVEREFLAPLGLRSTRFTAPDTGFVVTGVRPGPAGWEPLPLSGPGAFSSIGGLFSTVSDLSTWARYLLSAFAPDPRSGGFPASVTSLTPADRRRMQQAWRFQQGGDRPAGYGFGLFVEHDARYGSIAAHSGGYPGFSAHMRWSIERGIGVVAFENATLARVPLAATAALDLLLAEPAAASRAGASPAQAVLPETRRAGERVSRLLAEWQAGHAPDGADLDAAFSPNVAMDVPWDRRVAAILAAVQASGADASAAPVQEWSSTPTHLGWRYDGTDGTLRVEIRLAPLARGLVQTFVVAHDPVD
jgi:CubicO group peptidase (beta-lactamase class C family)